MTIGCFIKLTPAAIVSLNPPNPNGCDILCCSAS
jgi:hypothetical protein